MSYNPEISRFSEFIIKTCIHGYRGKEELISHMKDDFHRDEILRQDVLGVPLFFLLCKAHSTTMVNILTADENSSNEALSKEEQIATKKRLENIKDAYGNSYLAYLNNTRYPYAMWQKFGDGEVVQNFPHDEMFRKDGYIERVLKAVIAYNSLESPKRAPEIPCFTQDDIVMQYNRVPVGSLPLHINITHNKSPLTYLFGQTEVHIDASFKIFDSIDDFRKMSLLERQDHMKRNGLKNDHVGDLLMRTFTPLVNDYPQALHSFFDIPLELKERLIPFVSWMICDSAHAEIMRQENTDSANKYPFKKFVLGFIDNLKSDDLLLKMEEEMVFFDKGTSCEQNFCLALEKQKTI